MSKPLRKRICDAIKILKGEPLPIDLAQMPKITTTPCEVRIIASRCLYGELYHADHISRDVIRKRTEEKMAYELGQTLLRECLIQFREDDYEPALHASVRVLVPPEGE